ncbi:hypothetical protein EWM64_g2396 [Hericium alpestre]|uniref:Uncharacterized protein n=1 Tax=Hericium alpestre TaxID=135208 RepID=A0A4Z0A5K4_9AGAM|nr:hypothetical protein EWM64_g2396 [Hericium alpestre]
MSSNPRPTKRFRHDVSLQAGPLNAREAGPSTGPGTYQGNETGPLAGPFEPSPHHIDSAVQEDTRQVSSFRVRGSTVTDAWINSGHEESGAYNAQPAATSNSASDPTSTQQYHRSLLGPIPLSTHEQQQARPAEYPRLFLDTRSSGNLAAAHAQPPDVYTAISPSLLTVNPSFGSPGPSGQAIASGQGKVKGASGHRSRKRKAMDEDAGEEGSAPLPALPNPYYQPMRGQVYVPMASLGQQQAGLAVYLPSYGNFTGAPALMPGVPASASAPPFAMYPSQPAYGLSASDIQASTQSAPLRSDLPASGGLRRSPRLARRRQSEDGEEASEGDGSPIPRPAPLVASPSAPSASQSERGKSYKKKSAQNQRDKKIDRLLDLNNRLEGYRVVVVVDDGKGKKWTPQQQILVKAIEYVDNVQKVRNGLMLECDAARVECEAAMAELKQEKAERVQERGRFEQEKAAYQEEANLLGVAVKNYHQDLLAKGNDCTDLESQVQTLKGKVTELQQQIDEFKRS